MELRSSSTKRGAYTACFQPVPELPNISWKNFEATIKPVLFEKDFASLYQSIIHHGGILDPKTKKLRSSIGGFQEALHSQISLSGVVSKLNESAVLADVEEAGSSDLQVISTGVHAVKEIPRHGLEALSFHDGYGDIFITTTMFPTNMDPGFYRKEWEEGQELPPYGKVSWRRENINVQPINVFHKEVDRFIFNLKKKKFSQENIEKAQSLQQESRIAHAFYFGNHRDSYHYGIGDQGYPCLTKKVTVDSWMLNTFISFNKGKTPVAFLGDATGSTHPLAAIGAYLSSKNSVDIFKYSTLTHFLKSVSDKIDPQIHDRISQQALRLTEYKMTLDRLMVFLQARLCSHYSRQ